jgi:hypothetical protein
LATILLHGRIDSVATSFRSGYFAEAVNWMEVLR